MRLTSRTARLNLWSPGSAAILMLIAQSFCEFGQTRQILAQTAPPMQPSAAANAGNPLPQRGNSVTLLGQPQPARPATPPGQQRPVAPPATSYQAGGNAIRPAPIRQVNLQETLPLPVAPPEDVAGAPSDSSAAPDTGQRLTLDDAIALSFRRQPRLRLYLEGTQQARGASDVAFAPYLPTAALGYSVGGFAIDAGGIPIRPGGVPGFTVLPPGFALPVGLDYQTGFELAEMKLQWLICDFGRRLGRYNASRLAVDIRQFQTQRAFQTVANEVAIAYYSVLRNQALERVAKDSVRRAEEDVDVARKLERRGVIEREKLLRAEVDLAETQRLLDASEEGVGVSQAALNLAIGLQSYEPLQVVEPTEIPRFSPTLSDCLQTAITERRELAVARRAIQVAQEGSRVAKADFAPRLISEGALFDLQQSSPRGHADIALGFIKLEWFAYEGGRRNAELRIADSKIRAAMAESESIADTIAYQINETYRRLNTARLGIERARPAVEQAEENYRLVRARAADGDATPAEVTDAEAAMTRAFQNHLNSIYDYLLAIAKIEYAMGTTRTPGRPTRRN
ncbi:MAG TPA: TolC family protein [Pirellulales bacterium]|nr:TolC family protein [Pirellulales bacterium]